MRSFTSLLVAFLLAPPPFLVPVARVQAAPLSAPAAATNGFDKLFEAVEKLSKADIIGKDLGTYSEAQAIQQKRNIVSRNSRSLVALREALQLPIQHPPVLTKDDDFGNYDGFRQIAAVLDEESTVRRIDSNFVGAINSKLDCIELGVLMTRGGPLRAALAGRDIEIIGRRGIDKLVGRLDYDQTTAVAVRLMRIESLRPPFAEAIRSGKQAALTLTRSAFNDRNWDEVIKETTRLDGSNFNEDEQATLGNLGEAEITAGISRAFDLALSGADAPYKPQMPRAEGDELDPWSALLAGPVDAPSLRVDYEAARAQNRLLAVALLLRVNRLQNGHYPDTFDTAPDPFANGANLQYRRVGDTYALYSIGPNAKDDGGKGIVIPEDGRIPPGAGDDLVAPVLPL